MIQEKNIVTNILLTFVTCGIYGIVWLISINDEVRFVTNDQRLQTSGMTLLLILVTCGIYSLIWAYNIGAALTNYYRAQGQQTEDLSILYLVLAIFTANLVNYCLIQLKLNEIARASYNQAPPVPPQNMQ